jgi:hypothetical protein
MKRKKTSTSQYMLKFIHAVLLQSYNQKKEYNENKKKSKFNSFPFFAIKIVKNKMFKTCIFSLSL